jgi:hypothetical protein
LRSSIVVLTWGRVTPQRPPPDRSPRDKINTKSCGFGQPRLYIRRSRDPEDDIERPLSGSELIASVDRIGPVLAVRECLELRAGATSISEPVVDLF